MRIFTVLFLLPFSVAVTAPQDLTVKPRSHPNTTPLALTMLDSIIAREQGVTVNSSVKTSVIEGGLLLLGINAVLENLALSHALKAKYELYLERVISGLIPTLKNVTLDVTSPLDEFSVGTQFIKQ
jgi:unsaturated rhamnogalacturonyl hydrolase